MYLNAHDILRRSPVSNSTNMTSFSRISSTPRSFLPDSNTLSTSNTSLWTEDARELVGLTVEELESTEARVFNFQCMGGGRGGA